MANKLTLKLARKQNKLAEFSSLHEAETGDREAFDATLRSMAGTSKEAREASSRDDCDD